MELERDAYKLLGEHFYIHSRQEIRGRQVATQMRETLTKFLQLKKDDPPPAIREFLLILARLEFFDFKNYDKAISYLEESFRRFPPEQNPLTALTTLMLLRATDNKEALKRLGKLRDEITAVYTLEERKKLFDVLNGNFRESGATYRELEELRKHLPAATFLHQWLIEHYLSGGKTELAIETAAESLRGNPIQLHVAMIYNFFSPEMIREYPSPIREKALAVRKEFIRKFPSETYLLELSEFGKVQDWIIWDIGNLATAARAQNSEVILQSYHWLRRINHQELLQDAITKAAHEHDLRLLDQEKIFLREIAGDENSFYIQLPGRTKDSHPNPRGHRLIARIIYDYLNSQKLLPPELLNLDATKLYSYKHEGK